MNSGYALRALAVSAIISVVLAFVHLGLVRSVQGGVHSQDGQLWAGQRWSDMNNMYGWLAENTCRGAGRLHSMALCISYLSPRRIAKEGLGMGMKGSGSMLLHVRIFGWVSPAGFGHRSYLNLSGPGFRGEGLCECGPLAGNALRNTHYSPIHFLSYQT